MNALDRERVTGWLAAHVTETRPPLAFALIANGRSNLTYRVSDSARHQVALRRPPLGRILATAHDMAREFRVISSLATTPVPVPRALAFCDDLAVTGAPFYVMEFVEGKVMRTLADVHSALTVDACRRVSDDLVGVLAQIHSVDLDRTGLADLGRHADYVARQLRRWLRQLDASVQARASLTAELTAAISGLRQMHDALARRIPAQGAATLVHGDFRLGNTIIGEAGRLRAVLDWETCTIGDPLADLAILLVGWSQADDEDLLGLVPDGIVPTAAPGFATRAEIVRRYAGITGRDVRELPFYYAFGWWRMACILHSVAARYRTGSSAGDASGTARLDQRALGATEMARRALAGLG